MTTDVGQVDNSWVEKAELAALNQDLQEKREIEEREVLVVFPLGKEKYAISIDKVKEVVKLPPIAPIPQSAEYILGVSNIRGNVIAITDLAKRLGLEYETEADLATAFVVVLKDSIVHAGMIVSEVPNTVIVNKSQINTSAAVIKNLSAADQFIKGIVKVEGEMVILIDILEMIDN